MGKRRTRMTENLLNLKRAIEQARRIALLLHVSPDGDTCGTSLALRRAFLLLDKEVAVFCDDPVPHNCRNLCDAGQVTTASGHADTVFDLAICVDVADQARMGDCVQIFRHAKQTAQIDHHGTNPFYAQINLVRSPLSATAVLAVELIDVLGVPLDTTLAECLYTAVASDTGNFKHQNTDVPAMLLAARCLEMGVDTEAIARSLFFIRPYAQLLLLGKAIQSMRLFENGKIAIMCLSADDFHASGAIPEHTEGIVNFAIDTEGVVMACLLSEQECAVKCSLRSLAPYDISGVASGFGGGGHSQAAGCSLAMPLANASRLLTLALIEEWRRGQSMGL